MVARQLLITYKSRESIEYLQHKFNKMQSNHLAQMLIFLTGVELKKNKRLLEKIESTHFNSRLNKLILREYIVYLLYTHKSTENALPAFCTYSTYYTSKLSRENLHKKLNYLCHA